MKVTLTVIVAVAVLPFTSVTVIVTGVEPSGAASVAIAWTSILPLGISEFAGVTVALRVTPAISGENVGKPLATSALL